MPRRILKRNLIGCFLGQDFTSVRFAGDIFDAAATLISGDVKAEK